MPSKKTQIVWLWLVLGSLILSSCVSWKPSSSELRQRNTTIASNAQRISDADAAVVCYDMLTSCEKQLADTTLALRTERAQAPSHVAKGRRQGVGLGAGGILVLFLLIRVM